MITIFSIKNLWILLIVNQIVADQCVQKDSCECNFENGFGYNLHKLENNNFQANSKSPGLEFIFRPCSDSTVLPPYKNLENNCTGSNGKFAVINCQT